MFLFFHCFNFYSSRFSQLPTPLRSKSSSAFTFWLYRSNDVKYLTKTSTKGLGGYREPAHRNAESQVCKHRCRLPKFWRDTEQVSCWARSHTRLLWPGLTFSRYACESILTENQSRGKHSNTRRRAQIYCEGACRQHSLLSPPCSIPNHSGYLFDKNEFLDRRHKDQKEIYSIKSVTAWGNQNFPWCITHYVSLDIHLALSCTFPHPSSSPLLHPLLPNQHSSSLAVLS